MIELPLLPSQSPHFCDHLPFLIEDDDLGKVSVKHVEASFPIQGEAHREGKRGEIVPSHFPLSGEDRDPPGQGIEDVDLSIKDLYVLKGPAFFNGNDPFEVIPLLFALEGQDAAICPVYHIEDGPPPIDRQVMRGGGRGEGGKVEGLDQPVPDIDDQHLPSCPIGHDDPSPPVSHHGEGELQPPPCVELGEIFTLSVEGEEAVVHGVHHIQPPPSLIEEGGLWLGEGPHPLLPVDRLYKEDLRGGPRHPDMEEKKGKKEYLSHAISPLSLDLMTLDAELLPVIEGGEIPVRRPHRLMTACTIHIFF